MDVVRQVYELLRPFGITNKYIGVSQLIRSLLILLDDPESLRAVQKRIYMVMAEWYCVNFNWRGTAEKNLAKAKQKVLELTGCKTRNSPFFLPVTVHRTVTDGRTILGLPGKIGNANIEFPTNWERCKKFQTRQ